MTDEFPLPDMVSARDRTFWSAAADGKLLVQGCADCGHRQLYPRPGCEECGAGDLSWLETAGVGTVYSHTVLRRATEHPAFSEDLPYVVAYVELEEGPLIVTNIVDCAVEDIENGMAVEVTFEQVDDGIAIPQFCPQ